MSLLKSVFSYDDDDFFRELTESDLVKKPLAASNTEILEASSVFNVSKKCNINEGTKGKFITISGLTSY